MSSTRALRGFLPARKKGAHYDTNGVSELISPTTITRAPKKLYNGDLICIEASGTISESIGATLRPSGVFVGCNYVDTNGTPTWSRYWPGEAITAATSVEFHVITDPDQTYYIQGNATCSHGEICKVLNYTATVSTASAGSTVTGNSAFFVETSAAGVETIVGNVRVIGYSKDPDEGIDGLDQYPMLEVWLPTHRDRFATATVSTA